MILYITARHSVHLELARLLVRPYLSEDNNEHSARKRHDSPYF
jgi:hypothetical protein